MTVRELFAKAGYPVDDSAKIMYCEEISGFDDYHTDFYWFSKINGTNVIFANGKWNSKYYLYNVWPKGGINLANLPAEDCKDELPKEVTNYIIL